jgi:hypothetical protein
LWYLCLALLLVGTADGFELQGHRGARGLWPENTLEGFLRTLAVGVDGRSAWTRWNSMSY